MPRMPMPMMKDSYVNAKDGCEMFWIPPGPFFAGRHRLVNRKGFYLARYPVTHKQFKSYVDETGYRPVSTEHGEFVADSKDWESKESFKNIEQHPVCFVSMVDAMHYCQWARGHLPTEWLWEKAARGPEGRSVPWGEQNQYSSPIGLTNFGANSTKPVGIYPETRTPYGCEDLVGNVSEWVLPTVEDYSAGFPDSLDELIEKYRIIGEIGAVRGCAFLRKSNRSLPASKRRQLSSNRRNRWVGFRLAVYPE